ncbi:MAG: hypothetical protein EOM25_02700 [Deltaproteobacteria bacterium]|nr:hypothetical protein [Deltaproteobacteria bacterium]
MPDPHSEPPALIGAVLAGGRSSRLGRDKARIRLGVDDQLVASVRRLEGLVDEVWVVGRDATSHGLDVPWIPDAVPGLGPAGGVASILDRTGRPCLVTSCDLPFMDSNTLQRLIEAWVKRPPGTLMTTFLQPGTGYVESLVSVYEPEALPLIRKALAQGRRSLWSIFPPKTRCHVPYNPDGPDGIAFFNINFPNDLAKARRILKQASQTGLIAGHPETDESVPQAVFENENEAKQWMEGFCWPDGGPFCPRCGHKNVYRLSEGRMRCGRCRYTFHAFSRRWLNLCSISPLNWVRLLRLYVRLPTANAVAREMDLVYNTVYKALTILRFSILAQSLDADILLSPELAPKIGLTGTKLKMDRTDRDPHFIPVFGLLDRSSFVFLDYLPNLDAETIFHFNLNFSLSIKRMGHLVYTDRYQHYNGLLFFGNDTLPYFSIRANPRPIHLDAFPSPFWLEARQLLMSYNGITPHRFPLYLKEIEFRHNHREQDLFPLFAKALCALVPDQKQ